MLSISALRKQFPSPTGQVAAVQGVSLEVKEGEFYTLLGPSGCGKTTTLQCIAGLERPDGGEIVMAGEVVFSSRRRVNVPGNRRNLGMVFQSYAIWPHMTVFDNVAFPLVHGRRRYPREDVRARVRRTLELVKLSHLEDRPAPLLSGGQQQRVALARSLVHEPALLLLDEPLSNLDAALREEMQTELRQLVKRVGATTIYVTHDQKEALSMSDRIAVMHRGAVVQEGTAREIYQDPRDPFVAGFIGKSNAIACRLAPAAGGAPAAAVDTPFGRLSCADAPPAYEGADLLLLVRPEAIEVHRAPQPDRADNMLTGTVEIASFTGDCVDLHVRVGDQIFLAKGDAFAAPAQGETVRLRLPPERCLLLRRADA